MIAGSEADGMAVGDVDPKNGGPGVGLVRRLGALGLGVTVFNTVVGSGIFVLPAALARAVGANAPLAYLACAVAMGGVVYCFAAAGSRVPTSGGAYGYTRAAFGPFLGFVVGVFIWLGCLLAAAGVAAAIADGVGRVWAPVANPLGRSTFIISLFATFGMINVLGVRPGTRLVGLLTVAKLVPIAVLLVVGVFLIRPANLHPSTLRVADFGRAMILAIFAFQGMEGAVGVSGEVRNPARNIPLGLFGAMGVITVLYIAIQIVTQGVLGAALGRSVSPLADALAGVSPALSGLLLAGATVSMLGYLSSDTLGAPRLLFAFAEDGYLPKVIAAVHPSTRSPYVSILLYVSMAAVLAVTGGFVELVILSALATVAVYIAACIAAIVLQRRGLALAGPPLASTWLYPAAGVGILGMVWILAHANVREGEGAIAALGITTAWFWIAKSAKGKAERRSFRG